MRIVAVSDLHLAWQEHDIKMPQGDVLISAGDFTFRGRQHELFSYAEWLYKQPYSKKITIAGNHELGLEDYPFECLPILLGHDRTYFPKPIEGKICTYLQDSGITIDNINIYGSPYSPRFFDWAFNLDRGPAIKAKWDLIPKDTDILVVHGPPLGYGDNTPNGEHVGCKDLLDTIYTIQPRIVITGHIHYGYGIYPIPGLRTVVVNASICNESYEPVNTPIIIDTDTWTISKS